MRNQVTRLEHGLALRRVARQNMEVCDRNSAFAFRSSDVNPLGARGIGEIGLAGVAAAITAATYHATGVRVRELPIRIEDLLTSSILA